MRTVLRVLTCLTLLGVPPLAWADAAATPETSATVIALEGTAWVNDASENAEQRSALDVGDLLGAGDRVITGEAANVHLAMADGSSIVLGPNTDLTLEALGQGGEGSASIFKLAKGLLNAMVQKLAGGSRFEIQTSNAIAAVKGTDFEVQAIDDDTQVTVSTGVVSLSDSFRRKEGAIQAGERGQLARGRLNAALKLSKRDLGEFRARWDRNRMIHGQRALLLKQYRSKDTAQRKRLNLRQKLRHHERGNKIKKARKRLRKDEN